MFETFLLYKKRKLPYVDVDHNHLSKREAREEKDLGLSLHHEVQLQLTQQLPQHRRVRRQPSVLHTFLPHYCTSPASTGPVIQKGILIGDLDPDPGRKARTAV